MRECGLGAGHLDGPGAESEVAEGDESDGVRAVDAAVRLGACDLHE